jgi:hypothetical protein
MTVASDLDHLIDRFDRFDIFVFQIIIRSEMVAVDVYVLSSSWPFPSPLPWKGIVGFIIADALHVPSQIHFIRWEEELMELGSGRAPNVGVVNVNHLRRGNYWILGKFVGESWLFLRSFI